MHVLLFFLSLILIGCSKNSDVAERILISQEKKLKTDTHTTTQFHSVLYYPHQLGLRFPGIIVGVEKSPTSVVFNEADFNVKALDRVGKTKQQVKKELIDSKVLYVSHIVEFGERSTPKACSWYDLYRQHNDSALQLLIEPCAGSENAFTILNNPNDLNAVYKNSWTAMKSLKTVIDERLKNDKTYTHIIIATMGWNTSQAEAMQNFNSIVNNMYASKPNGRAFNPLFVGVTWPSSWESGMFGPVVTGASFGTKARDADELGLTWLGVILHQVLKDIPEDVEPLLIGHSFGARSMSVAACIGPAIAEKQDGNIVIKKNLGTLVSLQGAYEYKRLLGRDEDKGKIYLYPDSCANTTFWSTTSKYDKALKTVIAWGNIYAGDSKAYNKLCNNQNDNLVNCYVVDSKSKLKETVTDGKNGNINFINADSIISKQSYNTSGGAHSDIYRIEHGRLIWNILDKSN